MSTTKLSVLAIVGVFLTFVGTAVDLRIGVAAGLLTTAWVASFMRQPEPVPVPAERV